MRLFAQILSREAKKWFRDFPARSIPTFQAFQNAFLERWDDKKSPLQVFSQYKSLKNERFESIHEFYSSFMRMYNSIPSYIKTLVGAANIHYANFFDREFSLLLIESRYATLDDMMSGYKEVEVNLMESAKMKQKLRLKKLRRKVNLLFLN